MSEPLSPPTAPPAPPVAPARRRRTTRATRAPAATRTATPVTATAPLTAHVHEQVEGVETVELTPPHPPREETPEYAAAHHFLIYEKGAPCQVCGVTHTTLGNPGANPYNAQALESHHYPIERSTVDACDPLKVHADYPTVYNRATLVAFVDSPANLIVLCDVHHRSVQHGIHHLPVSDWAVQRYLYDGYLIAASAKDAAAALAQDERIMAATGIEQAVQSGAEAQLEAAATANRGTPTRRRGRRATTAAATTTATPPAA